MEERRLFPRFTFARPVELRSPDGAGFGAESNEISAAGVGMLVSRDAVVSLAQGGSLLTPGDPLDVSINGAEDDLELPGVHCRVKHVRRLSQDRYLVSVWFAELDSAQKRVVDRLIEQARAANQP